MYSELWRFQNLFYVRGLRPPKAPVHCWIQNKSYLKNWKSHKKILPTQTSVSEHCDCASFETKYGLSDHVYNNLKTIVPFKINFTLNNFSLWDRFNIPGGWRDMWCQIDDFPYYITIYRKCRHFRRVYLWNHYEYGIHHGEQNYWK